MVSAAFVLHSISAGVYFLGFSVFFLPLSRDFQISRTAASIPFALSRLVSAAVGPIAGYASDRFGPARVAFLGGLLAGLGYILINVTLSYLLFVIIFVLLVTPGIQGGFETPGMVSIGRWFTTRRSLAFSIASVGFAVGGFAIVPVVALSVDHIGWRETAMGVGIVLWAVVPILSLVYRRPPADDEENRYRPPNQAKNLLQHSPKTATADYSLIDALRTRFYWFIAISLGLRAAAWNATAFHLVAILVWKGLDETTAGFVVGAYPIFWVPAMIAFGWSGARWPKSQLAGTASLVGAFGFLLMGVFPNVTAWQILPIFALMASNEGSWPLTWSMMVDELGSKNFGTLRGTTSAVVSFMSIGAPLYAGWVFDATDSYLWVLIPSSMLLALAASISLMTVPSTPESPSLG